MLTNTRITVALFILTFTGCLLSQEVGRRPGGGSTNIYTSSINGIDTSQLHTNSAGMLGINDKVPLTNAVLKLVTMSQGPIVISNTTPTLEFKDSNAALNEKNYRWRTFGNWLALEFISDDGLTINTILTLTRVGAEADFLNWFGSNVFFNGNLGVRGQLHLTNTVNGKLLITGADGLVTNSVYGDSDIAALSGGGGFMPTLNGSYTNASGWGTFTNHSIVILHFDGTNTTDKDFVEKYSDYRNTTNMFAGIRGKSTSSTSDLYIGSDPNSASPENLYIGTGPRGWLNQSPQFVFTGTGSPRIYGQFNPVTDHTNDIGTDALRLSDIHMADNLIVDEGGFKVFYGGGSATPELNKTGAKGAVYQRAQFGTYKKVTDAVSADNSKGWVYQPTTIASGITNLTGGTITINNGFVAATALIFITHATPGGTQGFLSSSISAGTSFTINSSSGSDTSSVYYEVKQ